MNENYRTDRSLDDLLHYYSVPEPDESFITNFRAELIEMAAEAGAVQAVGALNRSSAAIAVAGFAILFSLNIFYTATVGTALYFLLPAAKLATYNQFLISMAAFGAVMFGLTVMLIAYRIPMIFPGRLANEH